MKRFRFSLESVRTLREQKEREAKRRYAAAVRVCDEIASRQHRIELELESCWAFAREQMIARTAALTLASTNAFADALEQRLQKVKDELRVSRQQLELAWQALLHATRDRDALDHYRDKLHRLHCRAEQSEEQKFLDELAGRSEPVLDLQPINPL